MGVCQTLISPCVFDYEYGLVYEYRSSDFHAVDPLSLADILKGGGSLP